jgi:hypothetical protein
MKTENLNLEELGYEYNLFLETCENVGCPMLASALQKIIGGKVVVGKFAGDPHCWVETKDRRYDLNNLVEGCGICLIVSHKKENGYKAEHNNVKKFAFELGVSMCFDFWTERFRNAMEKLSEVNANSSH